MMGQIADDIVCGFQCSWCGVVFEGEHGYPVACHDCWADATKEERETLGVQRATLKEM